MKDVSTGTPIMQGVHMRSHLLISAGAAMLAVVLAFPPGTRVSPAGPEPLARQLEVARLRAHFDSVDLELRQATAPDLTPSQRGTRTTLIGWLREYRDAGVFPQNDRFPGQSLPFFRDSRGVLCAMAYLIDRSGRGDLVDRVALTRNNGFIPELADDPELRAWLDSVHLSVAEAARIQPEYEGSPGLTDNQLVSTEYALTSILVSGASLTTVGLNLIEPSRSTGWAGLVAGGAGLIAGAVNLDGDGGTDRVAALNLVIGGVAMAAGLHRLFTPEAVRPRVSLSAEPRPTNARLAISPLVIPTSSGPRLGLAMHTGF
jgi:hypothetical protein